MNIKCQPLEIYKKINQKPYTFSIIQYLLLFDISEIHEKSITNKLNTNSDPATNNYWTILQNQVSFGQSEIYSNLHSYILGHFQNCFTDPMCVYVHTIFQLFTSSSHPHSCAL